MKVTAIIVAFNSARELPQCIAGLRAAGVRDVVLVDNASRDESADVALQLDVRVIKSEINVGFGAAVNRAVSMASEPYVLLVNPDCVVAAESVDLLVATLDTYSDLGAVVPSMTYPDGSFGIAGGPEPSMLKEWIAHSGIDARLPRRVRGWLGKGSDLPGLGRLLGYADPAPGGGIVRVGWVSGWCMLLRADAFSAVGGFDEDFFLYFEDVDLCVRLRQVGYQVGIVGHAVASHDESSSTRRVGKSRLYAQGMRVYFAKHGGAVQQLGSRILARRLGA
jgi:GT2 family glycosyltransferase